jgi:hypothetical protein
MQVKKQTVKTPDKEMAMPEDLELLNKKRKLQNKVLQKLVEHLTKEVPKNKK